jgi:multicomponent Na+:H+ antiporter subunit G
MTLNDVAAYAAAALVVAGGTFAFLAAVGMLRLPDLYMRLHAASKAGAVGAGLILLGLAVASLDTAVALRAILGIAFLLLTTPVSAHLLARSAYRTGIEPHKSTTINDLATTNTSRDQPRGTTD